MSIHLKAALLALGAASLFGATQANAACDGSVQQLHSGRTVQCYYLPTVSNGRVTGLEKEVNYGGTYSNPYGGHGGRGAVIGGPVVVPPVHHR